MTMEIPPVQSDLSFRANGKLLLTGEYFVLDGALALALPLRLGQTMSVRAGGQPGLLHWRSHEPDGTLWFEGWYRLPEARYLKGNDDQVGRRLAGLLQAAAGQRPGWLDKASGLDVTCRLDFPRQWGLGSSSTLISLIAQWSGADPFLLLEASFGGSGYDLACARACSPLLFQRLHGRPQFVLFPFHPPYHEQLHFVYLGRKQNTPEGIKHYRANSSVQPQLINQISNLTAAIIRAPDLATFEHLMGRHEKIIAQTLQLPRAKDLYFPDFWGEVKSLGAWGGDFVLLSSAKSREATSAYLTERGFHTAFSYADLVVERG